MKFKNLENAKEYFCSIFDGNKLPLEEWSKPNLTNEEAEKVIAKEKEINQTHIVVSRDNDLHCYTDNYLAYEISHARRGQFYYLLCNIETLEISVLATTPDGSGCEVLMPDILIEWFSKGYLVILQLPITFCRFVKLKMATSRLDFTTKPNAIFNFSNVLL